MLRRWREVADDHPVAADANNTVAVYSRELRGDVRVAVREAWMGGAPGEFFGDAAVVAPRKTWAVFFLRAVAGGWPRSVFVRAYAEERIEPAD